GDPADTLDVRVPRQRPKRCTNDVRQRGRGHGRIPAADPGAAAVRNGVRSDHAAGRRSTVGQPLGFGGTRGGMMLAILLSGLLSVASWLIGLLPTWTLPSITDAVSAIG